MKRTQPIFLWIILFAVIALDGNAQTKSYDAEAERAGLLITEVSWRGAFCVLNNCENNGAFSIKVKNMTAKTIQVVAWDFSLVDSVRGNSVYDHFEFITNDKKIKPSETAKLTKRFEYHEVPSYLRAVAVLKRVQFSDGSSWVRPESERKPSNAKQESIEDASGEWKIYDQVDPEGIHTRALVLQGLVLGATDKAAVMMLHKRQDGSWAIGFGLSIEGYTSPITIRGDDAEPLDTVWKMTPDKGGKMAELPLRDQKEFLQNLQNISKFQVTYPRHPDMVKTVLVFDVRGLSVALKRLDTAQNK